MTISFGYRAQVLIWDTKAGREDSEVSTVGHTAIRLEAPEAASQYLSLRPKYSILVNPLTMFFPSKGSAVTASEDIEIDGEANRKISIPLTEVQYQSMRSKIEEMEAEIEKGRILYHLFPALPVFPFIQAISAGSAQKVMSRCPFSDTSFTEGPARALKGIVNVKSSHCALATQEVLQAGGIDVRINPYLPWKLAPSTLGDELLQTKR